jgi:hypothetical protein
MSLPEEEPSWTDSIRSSIADGVSRVSDLFGGPSPKPSPIPEPPKGPPEPPKPPKGPPEPPKPQPIPTNPQGYPPDLSEPQIGPRIQYPWEVESVGTQKIEKSSPSMVHFTPKAPTQKQLHKGNFGEIGVTDIVQNNGKTFVLENGIPHEIYDATLQHSDVYPNLQLETKPPYDDEEYSDNEEETDVKPNIVEEELPVSWANSTTTTSTSTTNMERLIYNIRQIDPTLTQEQVVQIAKKIYEGSTLTAPQNQENPDGIKIGKVPKNNPFFSKNPFTIGAPIPKQEWSNSTQTFVNSTVPDNTIRYSYDLTFLTQRPVNENQVVLHDSSSAFGALDTIRNIKNVLNNNGDLWTIHTAFERAKGQIANNEIQNPNPLHTGTVPDNIPLTIKDIQSNYDAVTQTLNVNGIVLVIPKESMEQYIALFQALNSAETAVAAFMENRAGKTHEGYLQLIQSGKITKEDIESVPTEVIKYPNAQAFLKTYSTPNMSAEQKRIDRLMKKDEQFLNNLNSENDPTKRKTLFDNRYRELQASDPIKYLDSRCGWWTCDEKMKQIISDLKHDQKRLQAIDDTPTDKRDSFVNQYIREFDYAIRYIDSFKVMIHRYDMDILKKLKQDRGFVKSLIDEDNKQTTLDAKHDRLYDIKFLEKKKSMKFTPQVLEYMIKKNMFHLETKIQRNVDLRDKYFEAQYEKADKELQTEFKENIIDSVLSNLHCNGLFSTMDCDVVRLVKKDDTFRNHLKEVPNDKLWIVIKQKYDEVENQVKASEAQRRKQQIADFNAQLQREQDKKESEYRKLVNFAQTSEFYRTVSNDPAMRNINMPMFTQDVVEMMKQGKTDAEIKKALFPKYFHSMGLYAAYIATSLFDTVSQIVNTVKDPLKKGMQDAHDKL